MAKNKSGKEHSSGEGADSGNNGSANAGRTRVAAAAARRSSKSGGTSWLVIGAAAIATAAVIGAVMTKMGDRSAGLLTPPNISKVSARDGLSHRKLQDAKAGGLKPPPKGTPGCADESSSCAGWAATGECESNAAFMMASCKASCGICDGSGVPKRVNSCQDTNANCATWASIGECESNPGFMKTQCPVTCRLCQSEDCHDDLPDCAERVRGPEFSNYSNTGCYTIPDIIKQCAWTCTACGLKPTPKCKRLPGEQPAATPGSGDKMFESLAARPGATVLSSPATGGPWVVTLDNFLTHAEADALLKAGSTSGTAWGRSQAGDGVQAARTSSTAWCRGACLRDPDVIAVQKRVEEYTGVPVPNAEYMQVLEYKEGQFYQRHHDQNSPRSSAWGPRMYTFFMYLGDDNSYTGGETHFPILNITVAPAKGKALVWPSVLNSDPYERDDRTDHEALPVKSGVKLACNYWLHMYSFRDFMDKGCSNVAYPDNWG